MTASRPNGGAPGVDGVSIAQVEEQGAGQLLGMLRAELEAGTYRPLPVRRVTIPKSAGGERNLGVPAVRRQGGPGRGEGGLRADLRSRLP